MNMTPSPQSHTDHPSLGVILFLTYGYARRT